MEFVLDHWMAVVTFFIQCGVFKFLYSFIHEYRALNAARDNAVRSLLRTQIISIYHKAEKEGHLPIYNLENITDMYKAYKALGGNGAITQLYEQIRGYSHQNKTHFCGETCEGNCEGRDCNGRCRHDH